MHIDVSALINSTLLGIEKKTEIPCRFINGTVNERVCIQVLIQAFGSL